MMNREIEQALEAARPGNRAADPTLDELLTAMIVASEGAAPVRRRPRWSVRTKVVVGAVAGALVLGTASAAAATQPWLWNQQLAHPDSASTITLPSGNQCEIRAVVEEEQPVTADEAQTIAAARAYAKTIDIRTFDLQALRASMLNSHRISATSSLDDQYFFAVSGRVSDMVFAYVADKGLQGNISVESGNHCTSPR